MSLGQLKAFLEKVKGDSNLQEKLKAAKSSDEVVGITKEHGHEFNSDHLSEEETENLSGAGCYNTGPCPGASVSPQKLPDTPLL